MMSGSARLPAVRLSGIYPNADHRQHKTGPANEAAANFDMKVWMWVSPMLSPTVITAAVTKSIVREVEHAKPAAARE